MAFETKPPLRFCHILSAKVAGGNSEAHRMYNFLRDDVFFYHSWNSSELHLSRIELCVESMMRNETDVLPFLDLYGRNLQAFNYFAVIKDSKNSIMSAFLPINQTADRLESTGSLAQVASYSPAVICIICAFLVVFHSLFSFCSSNLNSLNFTFSQSAMKQRRGQLMLKTRTGIAGKLMLAVILRQYFHISTGRMGGTSFRCILILFMLLISSINFSFLAFTKTELVITDEPFVFDSYGKLVHDPKILPNWLTYEATYISFMKAKPGSIEKQLWDKFCKHDRHKCLLPITAGSASDVVQRISRQEVAIIMADYVALIVHAVMCPLSRLMSLNPVILRQDANADATPMALGHSHYLEQFLPEVSRVIRMRGGRAAQSGIIHMISIPTKSPMSSISDAGSVRKCLHPEEDEQEEPAYVLSKSLADYKWLCLISIISYFLATITLMTNIIEKLR